MYLYYSSGSTLSPLLYNVIYTDNSMKLSTKTLKFEDVFKEYILSCHYEAKYIRLHILYSLSKYGKYASRYNALFYRCHENTLLLVFCATWDHMLTTLKFLFLT